MSQAAIRKSAVLGLSFPYDWSNPSISDNALILNVLERGIFEDICRVCAHYGLKTVEETIPSLAPEIASSAWLHRMLTNIRIGFENALA